MFKKDYKKIISSVLLLSMVAINFIFINPDTVRAQNPSTEGQSNTLVADPQAEVFIGGNRESQNQNREDLQNILTGAGECSIGQLLAQNISNLLSGVVNKIAEDVVRPEVPTKDNNVIENTGKIAQKEVSGKSITIGNFSADVTPSWDAIGFCLVNMIIEYIGQATVAWINNGFEGSPVFVENPERFFESLADQEAGMFLGELSEGRLCSPFRLEIINNLANYQLNKGGRNYAQNAYCSLTDVVENVEGFIDGDFSAGGWRGFYSITQNPNNNPTRSYQLARNVLDARIETKQNVARIELDWGRGLFSFKDPDTGNITSPGSIIETQINNRLNNPNQRVLMADEFDEIIAALVNQLIKVAINETLAQ